MMRTIIKECIVLNLITELSIIKTYIMSQKPSVSLFIYV